MQSQVFLRVPAIVELTGFSKKKVLKDLRRFQWPFTRCPNSPVKLYSLAALETSYGISIPAEKVSIIARKLNRISVFVRTLE